jgi:hypothetical protein
VISVEDVGRVIEKATAQLTEYHRIVATRQGNAKRARSPAAPDGPSLHEGETVRVLLQRLTCLLAVLRIASAAASGEGEPIYDRAILGLALGDDVPSFTAALAAERAAEAQART